MATPQGAAPCVPSWWDGPTGEPMDHALDIPGYRLERIRDSGAQGVVLEAADLATGRRVALKVLPGQASQGARERFRREIEALATLEHPNVVTLFDTGCVHDAPWFAMRLVDGPTIAEYVDALGLPVSGILGLFLGACDGVAHAHQRGVLHRDVKPDNIRVDRDGAACVLDFGLARRAGEASLTDAKDILGTLGYAAPEQLEGDARKVDVRADVYGLGAVLYRLLTGHAPLDLPSALGDALRVVRESEPSPPSTRKPGIARDLDAIVLKALAKRPSDRYASADALARDVRGFLAGEAVEARAASHWYVACKALRRHRLAVAVTAGFVALATTSVTVIVARGKAMERERDRAVQAENEARTEAAKSKEVSDFFARLLEQAQPSTTENGVEALTNLLLAADRQVRSEMVDRPEVQVAVLATIGRALLAEDEPDPARGSLARVLVLQQQLHGADHVGVATACADLAQAELALRRPDQAEMLLNRALRIRRDTVPMDGLAVADTLLQMARVHVAVDEIEKARTEAESALVARAAAPAANALAIAEARVVLGDILRRQGRVADAMGILTLAHDAYAADHLHWMGYPPAADAARALGRCLAAVGREDEAEQLYLEARDRLEQGLGAKSMRVAAVSVELADAFERAGEPARAIAALRDALLVQRAMCGTDSPEVLQTLQPLARLVGSHGGRREASALRAEALRMQMRLSLPGMP